MAGANAKRRILVRKVQPGFSEYVFDRCVTNKVCPRGAIRIGLSGGSSFFVGIGGCGRRRARGTGTGLASWRDAHQPVGEILVFLAGWSSVVGLVMGIYSRWMSWSSMVASAEIFPLSAVFQAVGKILNWGSRSSGGARASDQPWMETTRQFVEPVLMNQGILVAALLFVMASLGRSNASPWKRRCSYVAVLWLGITTLLYGYHTVNHGYYQYYFRELLPPVCLLAAAGLMSWGKSQRSLLQGLAVLLVAAVLFGFVFSAPSLTVAVIASAVTSVGLSALFWFKGWPLRSGLLLGTFLAGSLYAGAQTGLSYNCPFPPSTVRQVSRFLSDHTETDDEILSGAVIWEFQARRRPLGNWAHPLSLLIRGHGQDQWEQSFTQDPPAAMVLDKTMQKIFFPRFSQVEETLKKDYYRAATYGQVEIFLRKDRELSK